ncbi:MAG: cold-shock protein [Actinomycetota bacterium]
MAQGTVKDYDEATRAGSLLLDDGTEVGIDATSTEGSEIRMLRLGQRVRFDLAEESGRKIARSLHIVTFAD